MALAELKGIEKAGGTATIFQFAILSPSTRPSSKPNRIAETLPEEVLKQMYAAPKTKYPIITPEEMTKYDGFLFGKPSFSPPSSLLTVSRNPHPLRQLPRPVEDFLGLDRWDLDFRRTLG